MALTEVERRLLESFEWQLNVTHLGWGDGFRPLTEEERCGAD